MADRGFITYDYFENNGASVMYQLFWNGCEQLAKAEVKDSQAIASVRIEIPLILHGSINKCGKFVTF